MDKARRGELLVEKEDTQQRIVQARKTLRRIGEAFCRFGSSLVTQPESIGFFRNGCSVRPTSTATMFKLTDSYDVSIAGEIENAVKEVVALQDALDWLGRIERDLVNVTR
jgi:hypothetical protein